MKHSVLLIVLCIAAAISCSPLKIVMNSKDKNGSRLVLTSDKALFKDYKIALGAKVAQKDTVLAILVTSTRHSDYGIFDKDDRLMMRLSDGSEILLGNLYNQEYEKQSETESTTRRVVDFGYVYSYDPLYDDIFINPVEMSKLVPEVRTRITTNSYALYLITKKQLQDIIDKGVAKLRIEYNTGEDDMPATASVSETVRDMYAFLKESLTAKVERSQF